MPGDFDGCRFDFRIDSKKGLMPAKRKLRNAERRGVCVGLQGAGGGGGGCSTLYSCKQCGLLLDSRQSLVEHKLSHRNITKPTSDIPDMTSSLTCAVEEEHRSPISRSTSAPSPSQGHENLTPRQTTSPEFLHRSSTPSDGRQSLIQRYISGLSRAQSHDEYDVIEPRDSSSSLKGRQLHETVQRLWMSKLKSIPALGGDAQMDCSGEEKTTGAELHRLAMGAEVKRADELQRLFVRRVTAAPGTQPMFYTSLMRLQSTQKKEKRQTQRFSSTFRNDATTTLIQKPSVGGLLNPHQQVSVDANVNLVLQQTSNADSAIAITPALINLGVIGQQQFVCDFAGCKRTFRELKHLKVHRMQHTNERPLACTVCNYSCRQRNSLNWHMKSRHGLDKHVTADGRTVYG